MSKHFHDQLVPSKAQIVDAPVDAPRHQVDVDRTFELPSALYAATIALYLAAVAIMVLGFNSPGLIVPTGIIVVIIAGLFGVPAAWGRLKDNRSEPMTIGKFAREGIMTNTGRLIPRDAAIQMLVLPVLILFWACAVVAIAALV